MPELVDLIETLVGAAAGGATASGVLGHEDGVLKRFPVTGDEDITVYHLPAGNTVLTLAIARYDLIVSDNPGATSLEIPSEAALGYTRTSGRDLSFYVQRRGLGVFTVNYTGGTLIADNDIDISTLSPYHPEVKVGTAGTADEWVQS